MAKRGEVDRHAAGLYWRKGTAGTPYQSQSQQLYRLAHDAPGATAYFTGDSHGQSKEAIQPWPKQRSDEEENANFNDGAVQNPRQSGKG
jgi:hypothetical protein